MTHALPGHSRRRHLWRIGLIACGVAATIALMAALPVASSAHTPTPCTPGTNGSCANPGLTAGCGLTVGLVLDESLSINSTTGATAATRAAGRAFVSALANTGSRLYVTAFSINARRGPFAQFTEVGNAAVGTFDTWIGGTATNNSPGYNPAGGGQSVAPRGRTRRADS